MDAISTKKRFYLALLMPAFFLLAMWLVYVTEVLLNYDFYTGGILPRKLAGLTGIVTSPLIHGGLEHLGNNSVPFFVLGLCVFYFYRGVSFEVFGLIYLFTGLVTWLIARQEYHIGASGLIYGMASFLFFSGLIKGITQLIAISLMVVFLYGSMVWYVFPVEVQISWESHLSGAVVGVVLSLLYRHSGPLRRKYNWEEEEDDDDNEDDAFYKTGVDDEVL
jgi:membrane associated rhomboid family serine protease